MFNGKPEAAAFSEHVGRNKRSAVPASVGFRKTTAGTALRLFRPTKNHNLGANNDYAITSQIGSPSRAMGTGRPEASRIVMCGSSPTSW